MNNACRGTAGIQVGHLRCVGCDVDSIQRIGRAAITAVDSTHAEVVADADKVLIVFLLAPDAHPQGALGLAQRTNPQRLERELEIVRRRTVAKSTRSVTGGEVEGVAGRSGHSAQLIELACGVESCSSCRTICARSWRPGSSERGSGVGFHIDDVRDFIDAVGVVADWVDDRQDNEIPLVCDDPDDNYLVALWWSGLCARWCRLLNCYGWL